MADAPTTDALSEDVLRRDILPTLFPGDATSASPTLILLTGHPGAGTRRPTARLLTEHDGDLAVVSGDDLRAFHPDSRVPAGPVEAEVSQVLARATAGWVRDCIRFARENRRSLMLEGSFRDPSAVAGMVGRFAESGFVTRVVVVGSRRAESLLTVASRYLRDLHAGAPSTVVSREVHDAGMAASRGLVGALEDSPSVDRLTILGRGGEVVFEARRADAGGFSGATRALEGVESVRLSRFAATQWLSELHHATAFARSRRDLVFEASELLVDLHQVALREVIPELRVPEGGKFATAMEQTTVANLVALRRDLRAAAPVDAGGPVVVPGGPERGGVSR